MRPFLAYDVSPPDQQCTPGQNRYCYRPAIGVWGPVNPAVGGPSVTKAFIAFTLERPQWIEATFNVLFFLSPGGMYLPGIGIDGYDEAHLSDQFEGGLTDDNTTVPGSTANLSLQSTAIAVVELPAGDHKIYAMEYARPNTFPFRGRSNQALIVRIYD